MTKNDRTFAALLLFTGFISIVMIVAVFIRLSGYALVEATVAPPEVHQCR